MICNQLLWIMNSIRVVLLYNKHGLLLDVFKHVFKFLCYHSVYDLLVSLPKVVEVTHLGGRQCLLIGVPDKKTEHIAKMVGNQRDNREEFNRRTGEVLARVGGDVIKKIGKVSGRKTRKLPQFIKKQVEQLIGIEVFETGLDLLQFQQVYS